MPELIPNDLYDHLDNVREECGRQRRAVEALRQQLSEAHKREEFYNRLVSDMASDLQDAHIENQRQFQIGTAVTDGERTGNVMGYRLRVVDAETGRVYLIDPATVARLNP